VVSVCAGCLSAVPVGSGRGKVYSKLKFMPRGVSGVGVPSALLRGGSSTTQGFPFVKTLPALRMTGLRNPGETASFRVTWSAD